MSSPVVQGLLGLVLLFVGGEWLVRGACALAARLGLSPLAVGLTVVAFGTSAPEMVVSLRAALSGVDDIALGNVVGSNIANASLILGLACLLRPATVKARVVAVDAPLVVLVSVGLALVLADGVASRWEGALLLTGLVVFTVTTLVVARRETGPVRQEYAEGLPASPRRLPNLVVVLGGLGALVLGGQLLVDGAVTLATRWGVSEATLGLTVVAVGTSLPELATSLVAAWRGQGDIAVGNVLGSNLFNVLGILGGTALVRPLAIGGVTRVDLGCMLASAVLVAVFLATRHRLARGEAALLLLGYAGYTAWLLAG